MINLFIFIILVAKALPFFIIFTDHTDLFRFSVMVLFAGLLFFFSFYIQTIGSGINTHIRLIYRTYIETFINLFFNCFICILFYFHLLLFIYILGDLLLFFLLFFMENIFINPFNYLAFDVMFFLPLDIFNINFALLVPIIPSLMNKKYRLYTFSNYYFNSIRDYSVIPSSPVINDLSNPKLNNDLRKLIGGGYTSYKNVISLGYLNVLLENKPILLKNLFNYLEKLENNKCFTLLPVIRWIDDDTGFSKSITITNSIKITKFVDIDLLAERLNDSMFKAMNKYDVNNSNSEFVLMNRV